MILNPHPVLKPYYSQCYMLTVSLDINQLQNPCTFGGNRSIAWETTQHCQQNCTLTRTSLFQYETQWPLQLFRQTRWWVRTVPPKCEFVKKWIIFQCKARFRKTRFFARFAHFCMCSLIITSCINKKTNGNAVILLVCVASHIQCHLKIVDEHSNAYEFVQTADVPGASAQFLTRAFPLRTHSKQGLQWSLWPVPYGGSMLHPYFLRPVIGL